MAWYWWVLIGAGVVLIGILKLMVFKNILKKRQDKKNDGPKQDF